MNWYVMVWKKYAEFSGRARRTEYWMFTLFHVLVSIVLAVIGVVGIAVSQDNPSNAILFYIPAVIYALAALIPSLAVTTRRLHDTGKSGWLLLLVFVPLVNLVAGIVIFVFCCMDSQPGPNQYGPNPKFPDQAVAAIPVYPGYAAMPYPAQPQPPMPYPPQPQPPMAYPVPPQPPVAYPAQPQPPVAYPAQPQPAASAAGPRFCGGCGARIEGPSTFCGKCGAHV